MFSRHRPSGIPSIVAVLSAFTLMSCGESQPTSAASPRALQERVTTGGDPALAACATSYNDIATAIIGPHGGTISAGSTVVLIPQHAVRTPTRFTVRPLPGASLRVRITANGHRRFGFARPIAVMIGYAHCGRQLASANAAVWHVDDDSQHWLERMPTVHDPANATIGFLTTHLSTYAVAH